MGFVIYDLETTGLNKRFDQILQFAAVHADADLERYMREAVKVSHDSPVLLDRFLDNAVEVDIDVIADSQGNVQTREHDEMRFTSSGTILDDPVLISAEFSLESDNPETITKRLRKAWILYKATQPFSYQSAARIFKNPPGLNAGALIEQTGLLATKVGAVAISERNPNYIVIESGATTRDVLRLIDMVRTRVHDRFHIDLELAISVW